jgi:tRNA A37 threonylcarbamoyltransferase TsaD
LRINSGLFATLFDVVTKNIVEHLSNLLREPEVKGTTNIIMVGGFSESSIIQAKVKEAFPDMTVIIPFLTLCLFTF